MTNNIDKIEWLLNITWSVYEETYKDCPEFEAFLNLLNEEDYEN